MVVSTLFITRRVKKCVSKIKSQGKECDTVIIGDKGRSQLCRVFEDRVVCTATDVVAPTTYSLAAALTVEIFVSIGAEYDAIIPVNHYVNPAVDKQTHKVISPFVPEGEIGEPLMKYEIVGVKSELMGDMY